MGQYYNEVNRLIDAHKDEMVKKWKMPVNMKGHYDEEENMERAVRWLKNEFEQEGFQCRIHEVMKERAGILVGVLGSDRPGKPVASSSHTDIIYHNGSSGKEDPPEIGDGKAYGPDVLDMKDGIVTSLYVVEALNHSGYNEHPAKILYAGGEESDHTGNDADIFYTEENKGALYIFSMETGHIENHLYAGCRTQHIIRAKVHGLGGHVGSELTKGKNMVHEAIFKAAELIKLTDLDRRTTVTISVINSGTNTSTTSIPDLSEFAVDVRAFSDEIGKKVLEDMDRIMRKAFVEGTTMEYYVDLAKLRLSKLNSQVTCLFSLVNQVAVDHGSAEFRQVQLGGASGAGIIAAAGIPTLCSCGPIREFNHNVREYTVVDSLLERAEICTLTVTETDKL